MHDIFTKHRNNYVLNHPVSHDLRQNDPKLI